VQVTTGSDAANTVKQIENSLSPNQMQQFQQLQQNSGRKLQQGPSTQQSLATIGELNQVDGAKPYPYDSWPQTPKVQVTTGSDAANTVKQIENTLSPNQMQQFQQLQQQQGRKLSQVQPADLAAAAGSDQSGAASVQHLQQVHATNENYEQQKQALTQNYQAQQQALQQQLAAAPANSAQKAAIQQQISSEAAAYTSAQQQLKAQTVSQNMNAQNWAPNVDWAAVPWPSQQS
jgi:hypothetical protein